MSVPPVNPLFGTQVIVDTFVVLVNVAAGAEAFCKVTARVARHIRHRKVGQKGHGRGVKPGRINHVRHTVEGELCPARRYA